MPSRDPPASVGSRRTARRKAALQSSPGLSAAVPGLDTVSRLIEARILKAERGGLASGRVPYGYRTDAAGALVPDPDEAAVVRRIFAEHAAGRSLRAIIAGLVADGVPAPGGKQWFASRLSYILDNPRYRGVSEYLFAGPNGPEHVLAPAAHARIVTAATRPDRAGARASRRGPKGVGENGRAC